MQEFILPDIGEGIVECELLEWLVAEGQSIEEDQPVAEVMTDKATVQIPAMHSGRVTKLYYRAGDIAKVHQPLFAMEVQDSSAESVSSTSTTKESRDVSSKAELSEPTRSQANASLQQSNNKIINEKALASPAVRRVAKELGIDINLVTGSGQKGRVMKEDVLAFVERGKQTPSPSSLDSRDSQAVQFDKAGLQKDITVKPLRGIQAMMCQQMNRSVRTAVHFSVSDECVMDNLLAIKDTLTPLFEEQACRWSLLPFMLKALSLSLAKYPVLNAQVSQDEQEIHYYADHNIGFAVATDHGLVVPNIKQVQRKSIIEIAQESQTLIQQARANSLPPHALQGGTITVSNIGPIGGISATPVINYPEVAIVATGKIQALPRFDEDGNVRKTHIMMVNWSGDHRIIDGATMVSFNNDWMAYLQHPVQMLTALR